MEVIEIVEIDRGIWTEKADYLKVKDDGMASTERDLRQFVNEHLRADSYYLEYD